MKQYIQSNTKGFTLIEVMIVIAIIGILAAIAIPNYISYRDKTFCTAAESDVNSLANALASYFATPANQTFAAQTGPSIIFPGTSTINLSGNNTGTVYPVGATNTFHISATDQSGRCPVFYRAQSSRWSGGANGTYAITL